MSGRPVYLITRADDCGSNATANRAIMKTCDQGIVKNVSRMACCHAIEEAARLFAGRDDICFGLHGTLNAEWDNVKWGPIMPTERVPSLVDERGHFWRHPRLMKERERDCRTAGTARPAPVARLPHPLCGSAYVFRGGDSGLRYAV